MEKNDCARAEKRYDTPRDRCNPRLRAVEDAPVPAADGVAAAVGHRGEPRAANPVRRAHEPRTRTAERQPDRIVPGPQLGGDRPWGREGQQTMVVAVASNLVTIIGELTDQIGMFPRLAAKNEERAPVPSRGEKPADRRRVSRIGPVVEGQRELRAPSTTRRSRDRPEEWQVLHVGAGEVATSERDRPCRRDGLAVTTAVGKKARAAEPGTDDRAPDNRVPFVHVTLLPAAAAPRDVAPWRGRTALQACR